MERNTMSNKCEIIERVAQPTLSIRTRAAVQDLPKLLGEAYGKIMQYLGELGETPGGAPFVAYYNMDMQDLDMEIGFPTLSPLPGIGEVHAGQIPAGKAATCLYTGAYNEIASAYTELSAWIATQGVRPTGVAYEFYLNDPQHTPAAELQTLILFPLG
jgi:effector-binding domain-containing protein